MDEFVGFKARSNIYLGAFWGFTCVDSAYLLSAHCVQWDWKAQDKDGEDKPKSCEGKRQSSEDKQLKDSKHKQKGREDKQKRSWRQTKKTMKTIPRNDNWTLARSV